MSINKIVHAAEIPRGSFYQYFEGKNDMLRFILSEYHNQMLEHMKASLLASNGDIFVLFGDLFDFTVDFVMEEKTNSFCKNLFADIKVNSSFYFEVPKDVAEKKITEELKPYVHFEMLSLHEEDDLTHMLNILFSVFRDATAEVFLNISNCEKEKQKYYKKLDLLKRGFMKGKR